MKNADIYQTLDYCENYELIKGPIFCSVRYTNGELKRGIKEPWLGEGFYFWDTRVEDAKWWGKTIYKGNFIIYHTTYNQHSPLLYDMVGNVQQFDDFVNAATLLKKKFNSSRISFPMVLAYFKKDTKFNYKAIRVWPSNQNLKKSGIHFPDNKIELVKFDKIQLCFFDKTLLTEPYEFFMNFSCSSKQTI